ncbi:hypothetical protein CEE45_01560 [Candidatus Heimdallarchaeota archaeon B3_Heim]|nr:MAG: hypothetical protein CEE45_01560 [Candidatus Heimdallarchaeota archaeon B3_Heim]
MVENTTIILVLAIGGLVLLYFLLYIPFTRKVAWKSVVIPATTLKNMRNKRKQRAEVAYVFDFNHQQNRAERIRFRRGTRDFVIPRANWDDEVIFHTHNKVSNPVENVLRERPSGGDLVQLISSPRLQDGLITPSGRLLIYEETSHTDPRKVKRLDQKEVEIQKRVFRKEVTPTKAREVNKRFLSEVKKAGIRVREVSPNQALKLRTEVREHG